MNIETLKSALNAKLAECAALALECEAAGILVPGSLDLTAAFEATAPAPLEYVNGITAARADGAIRVKSWDEYVARTGRKDLNVWVMRDAGQTLTSEQRARVTNNSDQARFMGFQAGGVPSWPAFDLKPDPSGRQLWIDGDGIPDAFAFAGDMRTRDGRVLWKAPALADQVAALIAQVEAGRGAPGVVISTGIHYPGD